ncbi:MAG: MarR family transcriptional regulator [Oscillospiraceae bacterium]|nr:MarR family transcriptional regulator [Oscillospiraceae bacterium]
MTEDRKQLSIIAHVFRLNNALIKQKNRRMSAYNLTAIQADVLMYVLKNSKLREINQLDVQDYLKLTNPTVSGIVDRLEEKEFIKRVRSERDARYRRLIPLPKGEALFEDLRRSAREAEENIVRDMSPEEAETFIRLIDVALETAEAD